MKWEKTLKYRRILHDIQGENAKIYSHCWHLKMQKTCEKTFTIHASSYMSRNIGCQIRYQYNLRYTYYSLNNYNSIYKLVGNGFICEELRRKLKELSCPDLQWRFEKQPSTIIQRNFFQTTWRERKEVFQC